MSNYTMWACKRRMDQEQWRHEEVLDKISASEKLQLRCARKTFSIVRDDYSRILAERNVFRTHAFKNYDPMPQGQRLRVRVLEKPQTLQDKEKKDMWKTLMLNVQGAVRWKAKTLRESQGILTTRQLKRRVIQQQPRERLRRVFPGACKTTWAMKKFMSREVDDMMAAMRPENRRRHINQQLLQKASLPDFVDRVKSTTAILREFRRYKMETGKEEDGVSWVLLPNETDGHTVRDVEGIDAHGYDLVDRMTDTRDLIVPEMDADYVFVTWNMELVHKLRKHPLARRVPWLAPQGTRLVCAQVRMGETAGFNDSESFNSLEGVQKLVGFLSKYNDSRQFRIFFASDSRQLPISIR
nr:hypothetical protein BaRGS_026224 [Batillaria attramentaria]